LPQKTLRRSTAAQIIGRCPVVVGGPIACPVFASTGAVQRAGAEPDRNRCYHVRWLAIIRTWWFCRLRHRSDLLGSTPNPLSATMTFEGRCHPSYRSGPERTRPVPRCRPVRPEEPNHDVTDKIEHPSTFLGRSLWVNRRSWPRKVIGHRVLPSIYRSFTICPRLPLKTFVGDVLININF
jgi:hypothetical protein